MRRAALFDMLAAAGAEHPVVTTRSGRHAGYIATVHLRPFRARIRFKLDDDEGVARARIERAMEALRERVAANAKLREVEGSW